MNDSSKSHLLIDKQHSDSPSLQNSKMAHMLVQQQSHRTSNISIRRSTSSQKDTSLPMTHSVDERLFLYNHDDSTRLLNLFTRFASEPQISIYSNQSTNFNGHLNKNPVIFALSTPVSNTCSQFNGTDDEELNFNDILNLNCDNIQPVNDSSSTEDTNSDNRDNLSTGSSEELLTINHDDELQFQHLDEDILLDTSPCINENELHCERHFRRRKRRSSITKNSISLDDTQPTIDLPNCNNQPQQQSQETNENLDISLSVKQNDDKQDDNNIIQAKPSENEQSIETTVENEKPASLSRYRGRSKLRQFEEDSFRYIISFFLIGLRHRFYLHAAALTSSPKELTSNTPVDFYLPNEALNIESPRIRSPPPSSPVTISPLTSPVSPTPPITSNPTSPNTITGGLKRINSVGITKKNVRFADSVGRELAQVQYIHSSNNDESKELSFLLGSSLLSSSPPSFTKNNLYLSNTSRLEHKPWSFDVALTSNKLTNETPLPRRFSCLYRQPSSEHPDIYLHELWKSQIKLEHADIPIKYSSTGEQQLIGKLWVTNASYWKYVSIKYTFNRWLNTYEREAQHRCHSNDYRNIDQFEFTVDIPADVDRIDFVLRYSVNGQEHWDNNEGKNYTLQADSSYTPQTTISLPHDCDFNEMRFY